MKRIQIFSFIMLSSVGMLSQVSECKALLVEKGKENAYPRLSIDGDEVLYQSNRTGEWQLFIRDLDGTRETALTSPGSNNNFPDWSYDNKFIAFVSDRDGNEELYLMKRDGSGLKRLTTDKERDIHPYFSPDGKFILFNSTRGNGSLDIYRYEISSGKTERLTDTPEDETCARYSPDMTSMVFLKNSSSSDDVWILNLKTAISKNISADPKTRDGWPVFSYSGEWIYYSSLKAGDFGVYRYHIADNKYDTVIPPQRGKEIARVSISRDGKSLVYNVRDSDGLSIWWCRLT